jgi:protein arginine N-methyltransferase 1
MSLPLVIYGMMMSDRARNEALARAIRAAVRPGDVVVDVGSGVGFLSILAAKAGAARVYALEATGWADVAHHLAERNGVAGIIRFEKRGLSFDWEPPERADVILSETLGFTALDEGFRGTMADARDRMLRPGGRLVPRRVDLLAAPVTASERMIDPGYIECAEGLDLGPLAEMYRKLPQRAHIPRGHELAPAQVLFSLDCHTMSADERLRARASFALTASAPPRLAPLTASAPPRLAPAGIALWFRAELADGVWLDSRDPSPSNHWGQTLLPLRAAPGSGPPPERLDLSVEIEDRPRFAVRWETELAPGGRAAR